MVSKRVSTTQPTATKVGATISGSVKTAGRTVGNGVETVGDAIGATGKGAWRTLKNFGRGLKKGWEQA